ncbi:zinc-ribbon domain-containing protein [Gluconobacter wancherniae]|uniref:zinc-ribbon domain-containing protein n=1 Tax=Gluconobacter wancherniae TaxID=1307955 RepID=UPI001B8D13FA|nr:zinc-ribbon domain-containing protein [Gluconobacter wancherniae]MBS1094284.1 zinc-ribbon domain-containing protein [Gluconobacter wancherniae]MBS1094627.1 zinc-ribbon domain-containing protein [Gluconobacter wancherniae]
MRLECPHCHAVFEVPEVLLGKAKKLRCANCGETWEPGDVEAAEEQSVLEPEEPASSEPAMSSGARQLCSGFEMSSKAAHDMSDRSVVAEREGFGQLRSQRTRNGNVSVGDEQPVKPVAMIGSKGSWAVAWCCSVVIVAGSGAALCRWYGVLGHMWPK